MDEITVITSKVNPRVKQAIALRDRRDRDNSGLFLIEGYRELYRAVEAGVVIEHLFFCPELFLGENESILLRRIAHTLRTTAPVFHKLSYRDRPDGLVAVARKMDRQLSDICIRHAPFVVVAESIEKPGNLGTILRSCDAAGVDLVLVANRCTDIYNPNVVRASVGTLFTLPVVEVTNEQAYAFCVDHGVRLIAATPEADQVYTDVALTEPVGVVVGTEQVGLSSFWKRSCALSVRIPMHGVADSLNVATATTLLLFEVVRQRHVS